MAKRFTDTKKWIKPWFGELTLKQKILWLFICDNCDAAGIADFSPKFFSMSVGFTVTRNMLDEYFKGRIIWIDENKFFIPSFIEFQYGQLSEACKPHKPIIAELEKKGLLFVENGKGVLRVFKGFAKGINTLEEKEEACKPHKPIIAELEKKGLLSVENGKGVLRVFKGFAKGINTLEEKEKEKEQEKETKGGLGEKEPFASFWAVYPKQRIGNKDKARAAFLRALKRSGLKAEQITAKAQEYAKSEEVARGYAKGAEAWLNDDRFLRNYSPALTQAESLKQARAEGTAKIRDIFGGQK